ncbi:hypothetical protein AB9K21_05615 [Anaplasma phagocytophilum]|uniref:Uncharacterized protein n=1 Tax=Anaplasma phagocytophilum str. ApNP TaxID=1359153 RepID=A0A0F3NFF0_ANAPH|nr:hypothetical protein APHNP_0940 [Anaplasma phagocytophilum str. ApNP]
MVVCGGLCIMRMLLMYSSAVMLLMVYRSFITACRIALLACMVGMVCVDEDELRGWNTGSPFVGVSVSMLCCLVMFLFLLLQVVILACLVASVSRYKSFAAVVMWVAFAMHRRVFPSTRESDAHVVLPQGNVSSISNDEEVRNRVVGSIMWLQKVSSMSATEMLPLGSFCPRKQLR